MTAGEPVPLWLFGATCMLAGELARLLEAHPGLELVGAVSRSVQPLSNAHPHLALERATVSWEQARGELSARLAKGPAVVVLALPHGHSSAAWSRLKDELGGAAAELHLVMISSGAAHGVYTGWSGYCSGKAAMDHWVRTAGEEQARRGSRCRIVAVAPGVASCTKR